MRGEDHTAASLGHSEIETPPRAWGRRGEPWGVSSRTRNTPTCVGKTPRAATRSRCSWKHPHVRGEDRQQNGMMTRILETPPRAWGRLAHQITALVLDGNTPTCVGKTSPSFGSGHSRWKHPHVRGEDQHIVKEREFNHNIHVLRQF